MGHFVKNRLFELKDRLLLLLTKDRSFDPRDRSFTWKNRFFCL
jgi:hypothetical protein